MSRYLLVPADGFCTKTKEITLPSGLVVNSYDDLACKVTNKKGLEKLLTDLAKFDISSNKDGFLTHKDKIMNGLKFDDAVLDLCNGHIRYCYEPFYSLLKQCDIVF